jgi:aspartate racemase
MLPRHELDQKTHAPEVLTSDYMRDERSFERYFAAPETKVLHPLPHASGDVDPVTISFYDEEGIKSGNLGERPA